MPLSLASTGCGLTSRAAWLLRVMVQLGLATRQTVLTLCIHYTFKADVRCIHFVLWALKGLDCIRGALDWS